jgi:hypothetical protein
MSANTTNSSKCVITTGCNRPEPVPPIAQTNITSVPPAATRIGQASAVVAETGSLMLSK